MGVTHLMVKSVKNSLVINIFKTLLEAIFLENRHFYDTNAYECEGTWSSVITAIL
jgi:hypothetical protein